MSARMQFPLSQRRHTNIAVVRYQKNGVRLEIACYKNKVISYRSGTESRLDEVLQVDRVFSNVGRGLMASKEDIVAVFGTEMSEKEAIAFMLVHGELQVAQQERTAEVDEIFKDVALIISQKCVNTRTQRPFPTVVIEQALKSIGATVKLDQPAKKQALGLIHLLIDSEVIPIARANMKLRCVTPTQDGAAELTQWCEANGAQIVERKTTLSADGSAAVSSCSFLLLLQPHLFRELDSFVKTAMPAGSTVHMIDAAVTELADGDAAVVPTSVGMDGRSSGGAGTAADGAASSEARGGGGATEPDDDNDSDDDGGAKGRKGKKSKGNRSNRAKASKPTRGGAAHDDDDDGSNSEVKGHGNSANNGAGNTHDDNDNDDDDDDDDDGARGGKKGKKKKGKKGAKLRGAAAVADSSSGGAGGKIGASDDLTAQLMKLGLDPTVDLDDSDGDDGRPRGGAGGRGKGKKGKAKKASHAAVAPTAEKSTDEPDSDDELAGGNRRQRRQKNAQRDVPRGDDSDDEMDG